MQRFEFRGPRFPCDLPVQLTVNHATQAVRCTEISETGMKLEIGLPLEINSVGMVSILREGRTLEFRVRIVHVGETHAGVDLIYSSDADRKTMAELIESLTAERGVKVRTV
jgi:hypothetical protein